MSVQTTTTPTAAPWRVDPNDPTTVVDQDVEFIADTWAADRPLEEAQANARLIAASPALYAAAVMALADLTRPRSGSRLDTIRLLKEAIAAATS